MEPNAMLYPNAFDLLGASICIRVSLEGVESDVILSERIDRALLRELGIDIESAKLEVWHEVIRKPRFSRKVDLLKRRLGRRDEDHTIDFGGMSISAGTAFTTGAREKAGSAADVAVAKEFVRVEGTDFLIESIPFLEAEADLQELPEPLHSAWTAGAKLDLAQWTKGRSAQAAGERQRPVSLSGLQKLPPAEGRLAMGGSQMPKGYVIDYPITLNTQTNFTFRGDTTYYVTNRVFLFGTTRLEGGAVIKTVPYNANVQAAIRVYGDFECATSPINPAIFTARDDNTVGETVADSTGIVATNIWYSHYNLMFLGASPVAVHDIQTRHGHVGVYFGTPGPHSASNVQVERCYRGIEAINATVHVRNALLHQTIYALSPSTSPFTVIHGEHLTIDTATHFFGLGSNGALYLTNSLLRNVGNTEKTNVFLDHVQTVVNGAFKTVGRGRHYLADSSPYRNAGTAAISPEMAAILQESTTWAPEILTASISASTTLGSVAERDLDDPDLGFHYYPLDYLAGGVAVDAATLTVGPGVRVGIYGPSGFVLQNGGSFLSRGEARQRNGLIPYNAVQSDSLPWEGSFEAMIRLGALAGPVEMLFTDIAALANAPERRLLIAGFSETANLMSGLDVAHSHLVNLAQTFRSLAPQNIRFFNNVIERCAFAFEQGLLGRRLFAPLTLGVHNNLFHKGSLALAARLGVTPWVVRDNIFDSEQLVASGFNANFAPDYNAFRIGLPIFGGANNRLGFNAAFEYGPLGAFYLTSESFADVRDAGSRSATEAGLFHFTVEATPFAREADSVVDIGFHYAMADFSGGKPDTDGDGLLDEAEDANGNGAIDPGETSHADRDTDLDGDSDPEEMQAGTNPNDARSVRWRSLSSFRFAEGNFTGVEGQQPLIATNISFATGAEDQAADYSSTNGPIILQYRGVETSGAPNVSLAQGSFRLRLRTFWVSDDPALGGTNATFRGVGPQEWVTLIQTTNIAVRIDPQGTNLVVTSRNASGQTFTNLQGKILLDSENFRAHYTEPATSFWNDVLITYSPEETRAFWGAPAGPPLIGTGIAPWGGNSTANQFLSIGSAPDGTGSINGLIEDVVVYNVPGILQTNPWLFSSTTVTNPSGLSLVWPAKTNALVNLKRRVLGETNWTWLPGIIGSNYVDSSITPGGRYEYNLNAGFLHDSGVQEKLGNTMTASLLGVAIESRGKVLLLVDETLQNAIQPELNMLITNLVGDGWSVLRTNVPRHIDDYSTTAAFATNSFNITNRVMPAIRGHYAQFSNELKHILILGHVTIPYTGHQPDDGHSSSSQPYGSHLGPWASDLYYSDMDGIWRDTNIVDAGSFLENRNSPGDGKLDNDYLPANEQGAAEAELTVARIDFARLPAFAETEAALLKRYLVKNDRFRHKQLAFSPKTIGADLFASFQSVIYADQIAAETASKLAVLNTHVRDNLFATTNSFVLGTQSSPGYVDRINDARPNMVTTANLATNGVTPPCAFYLFRSSFFQDWNLENNFMKAVLAPTNGGLASGWFISMGVWRMDRLAAGLELGSGWREVVSTRLKPFWGGQSARATQILGDSTLRFPVLAPPSALAGARNNGSVTLTWASSEPDCTYHVYRSSNGIDSPFVRLNTAPLTTNSFTEPVPGRASRLYMVRALKVTETGSGSFTNISQGVFISR